MGLWGILSMKKNTIFIVFFLISACSKKDKQQVSISSQVSAQVSAGFLHTCAVDDTGLKCWGLNDEGQTDVPKLINPTMVSAGVKHTCAIDDTGVKCWGQNESGQIDVP